MNLVKRVKIKDRNFLSFVPPSIAMEDENNLNGEKFFYGIDHLSNEEIEALIVEIESVLKNEQKLQDLLLESLSEDNYSPAFIEMMQRPLHLTTIKQQEEILERFISNDYPSHRLIDIQGFSGAGKTTLISQLLGFPTDDCILATATGKTTVGSRQFIVSDEEQFRVAATFIDYIQLETYINHILRDSAKTILKDRFKQDREEVFDQFFINSTQQFRMRYLLGSLKQEEAVESFINEELSELFTRHEQRINAVFNLFPHEQKARYETLQAQERATFENEFATFYYDSIEFLRTKFELIQLIKSHVEGLLDKYQLQYEKDENDWVKVAYLETNSKEQSIAVIQSMSSNDVELYGNLLTPIIQHLRAVGRFYPTWLDEEKRTNYQYIFNDSMGLDHVLRREQFSLDIETEEKIQRADKIVLVNKGTNNPDQRIKVLLEHFILTGQIQKLILCHTHMDSFKGGEFKKESTRQKHVNKNLQQVVALLEKSQQPAIETIIENASLYFSRLDEQYKENEELSRLIKLFSEEAHSIRLNTVIQFDEKSFMDEFIKQVKNYKNLWDEVYLVKHWASVKALNRCYAVLDEYEYQGMNPLNDLKKVLYLIFFNSFCQSLKNNHLDTEEQNQIQQQFSQSCVNDINKIAIQRLVESRKQQWVNAFNLSGPGSASDRKAALESLAQEVYPPTNKQELISNVVSNGGHFYNELKMNVDIALKEIGQQQPDLSLIIRPFEIQEVHVVK